MTRFRRVALVLLCLAVGTGCANIPEQTHPQPIAKSGSAQRIDYPEPTRDIEPITVIRQFIQASGNIDAARMYLTEEARRVWQPASPLIIDDTFSTVPGSVIANPARPDENVATVSVRGEQIGWLDGQLAFNAESGKHEQVFRLVRPKDGQWRIAEPPGRLLLQQQTFTEFYRSVKLYFFDTTKSILVPDLRYVKKQPSQSIPDTVVSLLLSGPSAALKNAVGGGLALSAVQRMNVQRSSDGAVVVNLSDFGDVNPEDRKKMAAQLGLSLQDLTASPIRLQVEGLPLAPEGAEWRPTDIQTYNSETIPVASLPGLVVAGGKVKSLKDGAQLAGPAGGGEYQVLTAAQSIDGKLLAVVERTPQGGERLRVGGLSDPLQAVDLAATKMTRPTWRPGASTSEIGNEVWTVADNNVARVIRTKEGSWRPFPVNATELAGYGQVTDLRLSRDGVRVAVVAGGKLYVGAVARGTDVSIHAPKEVLPGASNIVGVDWLDQTTLAVATTSATTPVIRVPIDGLQVLRHNTANLTAPVTAIAAAPSRQVVVTDTVGMWIASDIGDVWSPHPRNQGPNTKPFYPG